MLNFFLLIFLFILSPAVYSVDRSNTGSFLVCVFIIMGIIGFIIYKKFSKSFEELDWKLIKKTFIFTIILTFSFNFLLEDFETAINFSMKFICVLVFSILILCTLGLSYIKNGIKKIIGLIKYFGISKYKIEKFNLILDLTFSLMPQVTTYYKQLVLQLRLKGTHITPKNMFQNVYIILEILINNIFDISEDVEKSLRIKGFE